MIKFTVAFKIFALVFISEELLQNSRVLDEIYLFRFKNLLSIFFRVLRRNVFPYCTCGSGEDDAKMIQWPTRSCKLDLVNLENKENLCSGKWIWTSLCLVISSITLGLWLFKTLSGDSAINLSIFFLKISRRLVPLYNGCQKEIFFKTLCLVLKKGSFCILLVEYSELPTEINLKRYCGSSFL